MKNAYGITFLAVLLSAGLLTGPQSVTVADASAPAAGAVHTTQSTGGALSTR